MKTIKKLQKDDLLLINEFILKEKKEFIFFSKLGWSNKNIENHFQKKNNFSIGYFYKNKLYGILIGEKIINITKYDLEVHIMFVSNKKRRNKIGSNILNFVDLNNKLSKISKIFLEVAENNLVAIKFYEKNNFVFFKFRHNYYKYNDKNIKAMCYFKII